MKLKHYMDYLKILHARYGDGDFDCDEEYSKAVKPYYDKENNCIVIHKELRDLTFN